MKSKLSNEGYLMLDHSSSPGISGEELRKISPELPLTAGRSFFETPTYTCSHCNVVVILSPTRQRERVHCRKCDHYVCDNCGLLMKLNGGECKTFKEIVEEIQEKAALEQGVKEI